MIKESSRECTDRRHRPYDKCLMMLRGHPMVGSFVSEVICVYLLILLAFIYLLYSRSYRNATFTCVYFKGLWAHITHARTRAHTHTHAHTRTRTHAHTHTHTHTRTHAHTHTRTHAHTQQQSVQNSRQARQRFHTG